ncbi:MAG TPA: hypothetical protein VLM36_06905, partial [Sphingomicrobium sp.]|nr:hypothetical protein [Sphingomicrobium sp.]
RSALPLGCAIAALWPSPAAASDTRLFTPDTIDVSADLRLVAVNGEQGWLNGGFGKLRSGSNGDWKVEPQLGNVDIAWQPQLTWSLGATVVAAIQGGERTQAGLSQAYLSFRPMRGSTSTAFSARAGLMWPPVSLEHEGSDWHVANSITPSAINSWIGEEVRPVAAEGSAAFVLGQHRLRAVAALIAANDTAGTLLTFRGWALHDRTTLAFNRWNLPPLEGMIGQIQAPYTHPLIDLHAGFAHRPGYYAKLAWQPPLPIRLELFRYDNRANPEDFNPQMEWGWRTAFDNLGLVAKIGDVDLKAQALEGRTRMGFEMDGRRWIDNRFRSAFVLLDRPFGKIGIAARTEVFDTRNRGSIVGEDYNESGWSAMLSAKREWAHFTGLVELIHVDSRRDDRLDHGLAAHQAQSELQLELRIHR